MSLEVSRKLAGVVRLTDGLLAPVSRYGTSPTPSGEWSLSEGTGDGQGNDAYEATLSVGAGTTTLIDLKGGTGEKNLTRTALGFTAVKRVELIVANPAAGKALRVGPQAATDACQLWFPGVDAGSYDEVRDLLVQADRNAGWPVGASTKILAIHNPGGSAVSVWVRVVGVR